MRPILCALVVGSLLWSAASQADTTICVEVKLHESVAPTAPQKSPEREAAQAATAAAPAVSRPPELEPEPAAGDLAGLTAEQKRVAALRQRVAELSQRGAPEASARADVEGVLPIGQNPLDYLKRLVEHFVTHERGFRAVTGGCAQRLDIELYPLAAGWTAFARYSGTGREERVDRLFPDELSQFAERAALALLYGKAISTTIKRDTVLRADSARAVQRIRGTNHLTIHLGTELRGGYLPTALANGTGGVEEQIRVASPMLLGLGYRGKFESWGVDASVGVGVGTSKTGLADNSLGGHIDYGGNLSLSLHFLRYLNPRGLTSFYLGAGSSFEMLWMYAIRPQGQRSSEDRSTLFSGGLDLDLLLGVEFLRASRAQFFLQGGLVLPAYVVENEEGVARVRTWLPGISLQLGMMF